MTPEHRNDVPDDVRALVERVRHTAKGLRSAQSAAAFGGFETHIRVKDPIFLLADLEESADMLERLATRPLEGDERERVRQEALEEAAQIATLHGLTVSNEIIGKAASRNIAHKILQAALRATPSPAGDQDGGGDV